MRCANRRESATSRGGVLCTRARAHRDPDPFGRRKTPNTDVRDWRKLCDAARAGASSPATYPPPNATPGAASLKFAACNRFAPLSHVYITAPATDAPDVVSAVRRRRSSPARSRPHSRSRTWSCTGAPTSNAWRPTYTPPVSRSALTMSRYTYPSPPAPNDATARATADDEDASKRSERSERSPTCPSSLSSTRPSSLSSRLGVLLRRRRRVLEAAPPSASGTLARVSAPPPPRRSSPPPTRLAPSGLRRRRA